MKAIKKEYHIMVPLSKVWQALVDAKEIDKWGAGPAKMSDKEGSEFKLWGGDVHGKNVVVIPQKKLIQEWYGGDWEKPSKVTFTLSHKDGCTRVILEHADLPEKEFKAHGAGWDDYYLGPMKDYLEKES